MALPKPLHMQYLTKSPDSNHCVVVALAIAESMEYEDAACLVSILTKRKRHRRTYDAYLIAQYANWKEIDIYGHARGNDYFAPKHSVARFVNSHRKGIFILSTRGHWIVVKNGVTFDQNKKSPYRYRVLRAWKVE